MLYLRHLIKLSALITLIFALFPGNSFAYLDGGTVNYVLQVLLAVLLGASVTIKIFWGKLKSFFVNIFSKEQKN